MSVIYLKHAKHGTKVAISEDEAKADEKQGWERFSLGALLTPKEPANALVADLSGDIDALRSQYEQRFGKKPHHKKSAETLKTELAA